MQWIFMLVGLVLGALAGESVTSALLGGLIGLGLGQALRLQQLGADNARLREELKGFAERFERGTTAMVERLARLESGQSAAEPAAPADAAGVPPKPEPEAAPVPVSVPLPVVPQPLPESAADELVWELPELPAAAVAMQPVAAPAHAASAPSPASCGRRGRRSPRPRPAERPPAPRAARCR